MGREIKLNVASSPCAADKEAFVSEAREIKSDRILSIKQPQ